MSLHPHTILAILVVVVVVATPSPPPQTPPGQLSRPECRNACGNVGIPYPFGIGDGCYYNPPDISRYYKMTCNESYKPPRPMYYNMEVLDISIEEGTIRITQYASDACYAKNGTQIWYNHPRLFMGRFTISTSENVFAATGCDTYAWFSGTRHGRNYSTGCMTVCDSQQDVANGECSGVGCCQTAIPDGITKISIEARSYFNHTNVSSFNPCSSAFVVPKDAFNFTVANLTRPPPQVEAPNFPVVFNWRIGTNNCSMAKANDTYLCKGNSTCDDSGPDVGYRCKCLPGYSGNPYLEPCQDVNECADESSNDCQKLEYCFNNVGNYTCKCPKGFHGSGTKSDNCVANKDSVILFVLIGVCVGIIVIVVMIVWSYLRYEKKQLMNARERFFEQNGGHLLHRKLSNGQDVTTEMIKIFTIEELEKATNKFSDENVIGRGGFGRVYKGTLANNEVVAIKRSLKVDPQQSEQFVNEVIVLSKLNNRNIVKIKGCCLHTEVPLLVYEFINNGTLHHHLHDQEKAYALTWDIRLKIASEVAEVLSYLHTTISIPIIHRDVKSTNILLDTNYTAKVSDFGDSRLLPIDQDRLATVVLGTWGYLDPEYMQTTELTQKSDVYSFGVVLVELLTRYEPFSCRRLEKDMYLGFFFLRKLNEGCLMEILDDMILREDGTFEEVMEVANLAERCLRLKGEDRPTMKEVAIELHRIKTSRGSHPWLRSSSIVQQEETTKLLDDTRKGGIEMTYDKGNSGESSNSQVTSLLAETLESGR